MALYRMDHRGRFREKYLNDRIDQIQRMNKTKFSLAGGGGGFGAGGSVSFSSLYVFGDYDYFCPPMIENRPAVGAFYHDLWLKRLATPTWGTSLAGTRSRSILAESIRYNARGGVYDAGYEGAGWGGWDASSVSTEDLLTSGGYDLDGIESQGYQSADILAPYSYPESVDYGGLTAWTGDNWDYGLGFVNQCESYPNILTRTLREPINGLHWGLKSTGGGVADVFPYSPEGRPGGGNFVSADLGGASFNLDSTPVAFPHLLQSLPPGAVVVEAKIPVKLSSFSYSTWSTNPTVSFDEVEFLIQQGMGSGAGSAWVYDDGLVTPAPTTTGSVTMVLMGRKTNGTRVEVGTGNIKRVTAWEFIGSGGSMGASSNAWAIADVTDLCNMFLSIKHDLTHMNEFAFFPSIGAPVTGGGTKGWLAGMAVLPETIIAQNPHWFEYGSGPEYQLYKQHIDPFGNMQTLYDDLEYLAGHSGESVSWGGISFGEGVLEWKYGTSEAGRAVTVRNMVRGDSPVTV